MLMKRACENMYEIKNDVQIKIDYIKTAKIINPENLYIDVIKLYLDEDKENEFEPINVDKYKLKQHIKFTKLEDGIWKAKINFVVKYNDENQDINAVCTYFTPNTLKLINLVKDDIFKNYFYKSFSVRVCEDK